MCVCVCVCVCCSILLLIGGKKVHALAYHSKLCLYINCFYVFEKSITKALFDQKYISNSNIVK